MRLLLAAIALAAVAEAQNASLSSVSGASSGASAFTVPSGISGEPLPSTSSQSSGSSLRATASTSAATGSTTDVGGAQSNTGANAVDSEGGIPEGYTSETIPAPLNVTQHFTPKWRKAHRKAREFLKDWTPEEKIKLVTGSGWMVDRCVGNTPPIADRNWKGLCLQDGPLGIRFSYVKASVVKIDLKTEIADDLRDQNSVFPAAINAAATFDKELMYLRGKAMGEEFKGKGVHVALSPMTNMGRVAAGGRNWEGFGGDSYLSGHGTAETIKGLQKAGVQACVKHYINNEEERVRHRSSSNIDDRTLHEVYLHPFLKAVKDGHVASVMCSYNLINGTHACQNSKTQNGVLKRELGFGGYILSDWDGTHSGVMSVNNGLDMTMPGDIGMDGGKTTYFGQHLLDAVKNGSVSVDRFDDMAQRIIAGWFLLDQDKNFPDVNFESWRPDGPNNSHVDVRDDHDELIRTVGAASVVMLKNTDNALPLCKPKTIAIIGSDMGPSTKGPNGYADRAGDEGTLAIGWGSGTSNFPYLVTPLEAISLQARKDHSVVNWWLRDWDLSGAASVAMNAEVCLVGINSDSGEEYLSVDGNVGDRNNLTAWNNGDNLVKAVAAKCNNTIVIVHSVGPMLVEEWIDHPNVTGVLWAGLPGQESGTSLVDVLYGAWNPSGRLPYTIARNRTDYSADITYVPTNSPRNNVYYNEGLDIDYKHFLRHGIEPRFPFGFGMSYTTFEYSAIGIEWITQPDGRSNDSEEEEDPEFGRSVRKELHTPKWRISANVQNTGKVFGGDIPQLYIVFPAASGEPPRLLRDFERLHINPGETRGVSFELSPYDVSIWDVVAQDWVIPDGEFKAIIAHHSFDDTGVLETFWPGKC